MGIPNKYRMLQDLPHSEVKKMFRETSPSLFEKKNHTLTLGINKKKNGKKSNCKRIDSNHWELTIGKCKSTWHLMLIDRVVILRTNDQFKIEDQELMKANKDVQQNGYKVIQSINRGQILLGKVLSDNVSFERNTDIDWFAICESLDNDPNRLLASVNSFILQNKSQSHLKMVKTGERHTQQLTKEREHRKKLAKKVKIS